VNRAMNVLVLNSGRSSLKFQVIATDLERMKQDRDDRLCRGEVEGIGGEPIIMFQCHVVGVRGVPADGPRKRKDHLHSSLWDATSTNAR
jgi:acetate kinase